MSESTIALPQNFTIHQIEQISTDLKLAFEAEVETLILDATNVESVDTSGLQLVLVLIKQALSDHKNIQWTDSPSETFLTSAKRIGLNEKLMLP